ncbi:hypothetical protein EIQ03_07490 [Xanthomonas campestris pv. raphani]
MTKTPGVSLAWSQSCGTPRKKHMKTVLSVFGSLVLLGAVSTASAYDFSEQQANAQSLWDQQVQCVNSSGWSGTADCLGTVWSNYLSTY